MQQLIIALGGLLAAGWLIQGLRACLGMSRLPKLSLAAAVGTPSPRISILLAARDEAEKLPGALASLLALDYPNYEVIAANDRSSDATAQILDDVARRNPRFKAVHIRELPYGWLGKPHALATAYTHSTADWLVFTDADVHFSADLLGRAMALAQAMGWDHLTLMARVHMRGFWEPVAITYLGLCFVFGIEPWRVSHPRATRSYMGVGAFQLLRRSAYEAIGTHRKLAMEVVDDMKLGKLVKRAGFRSGTASAGELVQVRWQDGLANVVRGLTKNLFAGFGFSVPLTLLAVAVLFGASILPFLALGLTSGVARIEAAAAAVIAVSVHGFLIRGSGTSPWFGLTHPLGAVLFIYIALRSMLVTLLRGGVTWRDTFYPLAELRAGLV